MGKQTLDNTAALRHAGLCAAFMWQDEAAEGRLDGSVEVDYATIIGTLPEKANGSSVYIVHVDGTATSEFGYSYPVERDLKISLQENGEPLAAPATDEEIAQAVQHMRDLACKEYAGLMQLISAGAYDERDHEGNYGEDGIEKRIDELEEAALCEGLHFAARGDTYILEAATQEELDAYAQAKAEAEDEDDE